ncbi:MAG TPA: hypothetical protein PLZ31_09765 [Myxococcota bacterium]|nr:hypothetical protein [Myxococcota bacterium]HNZ03961.1 hypothetical protein [Myxococcota bacterium]HPB51494.1 hypothetical protein [Myxococcota bacterium]
MDGYHGDGGEAQGGVPAGEQPEQTERRGGDGMLTELARRAVATSVSKLVETEGFIREVVKAMSRELAGYVSREVHGLRQDMVEQVGDQVGRWLDRVDMADEIRRGLNGMTFDIQVKVKVTDDGLKPVGKPAAKKPAVKKPARKSARKPDSDSI